MRWSCLLAAAFVVACSPASVVPAAVPGVVQPVVIAQQAASAQPTATALAKQILVPTPTLATAATAAPSDPQLATGRTRSALPSVASPSTMVVTPAATIAPPTAATTPAPVATPTPAPIATPVPYDPPLLGPVIDKDYADPSLLIAGGAFYAFATNANGSNVQASVSTDLVHWRDLPDALPTLPAWSRPGFTWAPEVTRTGSAYVMYFTARHAPSGRQCIGAATAASPAGPYRPQGGVPLVCEPQFGGSIDPYPFVDSDGSRYLVWKTDSNAIGTPTVIKIARLAPDGLSFLSIPTALIANDLPWEGAVVEAPTLVKRGGAYVLFYSANDYAGAAYAVGVATASSLGGPWVKSPRPLLASADGRIGPGGQTLGVIGTDTWMLYHAWSPSGPYRDMRVAQIVWDGARPTVMPATMTSLARITP